MTAGQSGGPRGAWPVWEGNLSTWTKTSTKGSNKQSNYELGYIIRREARRLGDSMMIEGLVPKRGEGTVLIWWPASWELMVKKEPAKPSGAGTVHQSTPVCWGGKSLAHPSTWEKPVWLVIREYTEKGTERARWVWTLQTCKSSNTYLFLVLLKSWTAVSASTFQSPSFLRPPILVIVFRLCFI